MSNVNWTEVIAASISLLSMVLGIIKAQQAAGHASDAADHADRAGRIADAGKLP